MVWVAKQPVGLKRVVGMSTLGSKRSWGGNMSHVGPWVVKFPSRKCRFRILLILKGCSWPRAKV